MRNIIKKLFVINITVLVFGLTYAMFDSMWHESAQVSKSLYVFSLTILSGIVAFWAGYNPMMFGFGMWTYRDAWIKASRLSMWSGKSTGITYLKTQWVTLLAITVGTFIASFVLMILQELSLHNLTFVLSVGARSMLALKITGASLITMGAAVAVRYLFYLHYICRLPISKFI